MTLNMDTRQWANDRFNDVYSRYDQIISNNYGVQMHRLHNYEDFKDLIDEFIFKTGGNY